MISNPLFELIHSLSPTEKGYIKKKSSSKNGEDNFYIKLFDAIAAQEEYDEEKIIKKFKGEIFIKNISKSKNHLYNLILKRLSHYHEENIVEIKIKGILNQSVVLHKKGLYEHALNHYEKALKMALDNEDLHIASEIYSKMMDIYFMGNMGMKFPYEKEYDEISEKLWKEQKINYLNTKMAELLFAYNFNKEEDAQKISSLIKHSVLNAITDNDSFVTQWGKMSLISRGYYLLREHDKEKKIKMEQLEFLEKNKNINEKNPLRYVKHLANLINVKLNVGDYDALPELLEKLKTFKCKKTLFGDVNTLQKATYHIQLLAYLIQSNRFDKAYEKLEEAMDWFNHNEAAISDYFKMIFYDIVFIIYFSRAEFRKCIPCLNKMLNVKSEFRKEFQLSIKFYQLLLHYELKNYELIGYQIKAIYRELLKQNSNQETGKYILRWFQNRINNIGVKPMKQSAAEIKSRLHKMIDSGEWKSLSQMDLLNAWIDSKITDRPIAYCYASLFRKEIMAE